MRVVHVCWRDSHDILAGEWVDKPTKEDVGCIVNTVGFLVYEDRRHLVITHSIVKDDGWVRGSFAIPKGCVIRKVNL